MSRFQALAFAIVCGCTLFVIGGCGKSGKAGVTIDAGPDGPTVLDTAIAGSGGVSSGGISGTAGNGTGGADAMGNGGSQVGSGGIGGTDAALTSTGGTGSGGAIAGGAAGTATGGNGAGGGGSSDASVIAGGASGSATGGNRDAGPSGTGGIGMTGGVAGGSGGSVGSGGSHASNCPQTAPMDAAACSQPASCFYEDCATAGRTVAICSGTSWQVTTGACTIFTCTAVTGAQTTCPLDQVCLANYPKDPVCVSHTCGTGPLTTECVPGADPGTTGFCRLEGSAASGITMRCCPTGGTSC
jgi:hypothetical protein